MRCQLAIIFVALLAAGARADDVRPGYPVIDSPGSGTTLPASQTVTLAWHMPDVYAKPSYYEAVVKRRGADSAPMTVAAQGTANGDATAMNPIALQPGDYVFYLTAVNSAGRTEATPSAFTVKAALPANGQNAPAGPTNGITGNVGGARPALGPSLAPPPSATPQPPEGGTTPPAKVDAAPPPPQPKKDDAPAPLPRKAVEAKPADDPDFEGTDVAGTVKPKAEAPKAEPAPAPAGDKRSVHGRLLVLPENEKLGFSKDIARVDAAWRKLLSDEERAASGDEVVRPAAVQGELEVWVVEVVKGGKKNAPLRRFRVYFDDPREAGRLRARTGAKVGLEGVQRGFDEPVSVGEAGELLSARIVAIADR